MGVSDPAVIKYLKKELRPSANIRIYAGTEGIEEIASVSDADMLVMAISGNASLLPLVSAIEAGKRVALASKEPLVSAGEVVLRKARKS